MPGPKSWLSVGSLELPSLDTAAYLAHSTALMRNSGRVQAEQRLQLCADRVVSKGLRFVELCKRYSRTLLLYNSLQLLLLSATSIYEIM